MTIRRGVITVQFLRRVPVAKQDEILEKEYGIPIVFRNDEKGLVLLLIPCGQEEAFIEKFHGRDDIESCSLIFE